MRLIFSFIKNDERKILNPRFPENMTTFVSVRACSSCHGIICDSRDLSTFTLHLSLCGPRGELSSTLMAYSHEKM